MPVSIHAPREGCDAGRTLNQKQSKVSIHAPREGCDHCPDRPKDGQIWFQFTHPGRGATNNDGKKQKQIEVSIHAPREGCDPFVSLSMLTTLCFNSRTPGGVRLVCTTIGETFPVFQFTHPGRGATELGLLAILAYMVSIHAPREGCDAHGLLL